ncbi:hypothetical protein INS49_006886 [Diaporthe citri]|uniref:uncharacterized protein n=1 Tax=Diaporthe citri TaxID=83186 RepID=UPI001C7E8C0B|nr:uncharacterized protein INS49_006886 [Diaporthe citri]KAG6365277.1 hypothetical protein INS49_006886 [Diaporthe citri]
MSSGQVPSGMRDDDDDDDDEKTGVFTTSRCAPWVHVHQKQTSFEKVHGSRAPQKLPSANADAGVGLQQLLVVSLREGTDVLVLACFGVCCVSPKRKEGVGLGLNNKRRAGQEWPAQMRSRPIERPRTLQRLGALSPAKPSIGEGVNIQTDL